MPTSYAMSLTAGGWRSVDRRYRSLVIVAHLRDRARGIARTGSCSTGCLLELVIAAMPLAPRSLIADGNGDASHVASGCPWVLHVAGVVADCNLLASPGESGQMLAAIAVDLPAQAQRRVNAPLIPYRGCTCLNGMAIEPRVSVDERAVHQRHLSAFPAARTDYAMHRYRCGRWPPGIAVNTCRALITSIGKRPPGPGYLLSYGLLRLLMPAGVPAMPASAGWGNPKPSGLPAQSVVLAELKTSNRATTAVATSRHGRPDPTTLVGDVPVLPADVRVMVILCSGALHGRNVR